MFGEVTVDQQDAAYEEDEAKTEIKFDPNTVQVLPVIPKVEPLCPAETNSDDENVPSEDEQEEVQIPYTTPYKLKDPIIVLENCDKIWETLQVIKNIQQTKKTGTDGTDPLLPEATTSKSSYIEYKPVLNNNNTELPDFKFAVKNKKKLHNCPTCGRSYTKKQTMRDHSRKVHGIYIPAKRLRFDVIKVNFNKSKEKEPDTSTEDDSLEGIHSKKTDDKVPVAALPQPTSSLIVPDTQKRNRNSSSHNNGIETRRNEQEKKASNKQSKQIEKPSSTPELICTLCKQSVTDMKSHLINYHKIESPDFMLKNLNETSSISTNEVDTVNRNGKISRISNSIVEKHSLQSKHKVKRRATWSYEKSFKKRKINSNNAVNGNNLQDVDSYQCKICYNYYKISGFYSHIRLHRVRGETAENFHRLGGTRYCNSPSYLKSKMNSNSSEMSSNVTKNKGIKDKAKENKQGHILDPAYRQLIDCVCGRSFRNPYTLSVHKKKCCADGEVNENNADAENNAGVEINENRTRRYVTRSISEKDLTTGINITIKKKDDSYEIIGRENETENKLQQKNDLGNINVSLTTENHNENETLESSKYSNNHSVLKIQTVDEDVEIDIEDDTQNSHLDSTSETMNNIKDKNLLLGTIKLEPNDESYQENSAPDLLKEKHITLKHNGIKNFGRESEICVCGRKFHTRKALDVHIKQHHPATPLTCGYCKESFTTNSKWYLHGCTTPGKKNFVEVPFQIDCHYCSVAPRTYKDFDEHMRKEHIKGDTDFVFQCFQCTQRFSAYSERQQHYFANHKKTVCSVCSIECSERTKSKHMAYHYGLGFPCHYCKKAYTKANYIKHLSNYRERNGHLRQLVFSSKESAVNYSTTQQQQSKTDMTSKSSMTENTA